MMDVLDFRRIAIIYIASNKVRLTIYDQHIRGLIPILNEKNSYPFASHYKKRNRLPPSIFEKLVQTLNNYREIAEVHHSSEIICFGSLFFNELVNGNEIAKILSQSTQINVQTISLEQDLYYDATGLCAGIPDARGIFSHIGGRAIGFGRIENDNITNPKFLLLGALLRHSNDKIATALKKLTDSYFDKGITQKLYVTGSYWRMIAKCYYIETDYPIKLIHHLELSSKTLTHFLKGLLSMPLFKLRKRPFYKKLTMPFNEFYKAIQIIHQILQCYPIDQIIFSTFGPSEGYLYTNYTAREKSADALLDSCALLSQELNQSFNDKLLFKWFKGILPMFKQIPERIIKAALLLSEIGWLEHPEYRKEISFQRTLTLPLPAINHLQRFYLACSIAVRYGSKKKFVIEQLKAIKAPELHQTADEIILLGRLLYLLYKFSKGSPQLLSKMQLAYQKDQFSLSLSPTDAMVLSPIVRKAFKGYKINYVVTDSLLSADLLQHEVPLLRTGSL